MALTEPPTCISASLLPGAGSGPSGLGGPSLPGSPLVIVVLVLVVPPAGSKLFREPHPDVLRARGRVAVNAAPTDDANVRAGLVRDDARAVELLFVDPAGAVEWLADERRVKV